MCQETESTCLGTRMLTAARMKARLSRKESFESSAITVSTSHLVARSTAERSEMLSNWIRTSAEARATAALKLRTSLSPPVPSKEDGLTRTIVGALTTASSSLRL